MTRIVATWPDGETLTWTDGELSAGPVGKNPKQIAFEQLDGDVPETPEGPWIAVKDWPTNPYSFLGGVEAMTQLRLYPEPKVAIGGDLPPVEEGGVSVPPEVEVGGEPIGPPADLDGVIEACRATGDEIALKVYEEVRDGKFPDDPQRVRDEVIRRELEAEVPPSCSQR